MNLTITFSICVILIKYKIFINVRQLIKRILKEEKEKDLSSAIKELLNNSIGPKYKGIICKFDAVAPWKMYKDPINRLKRKLKLLKFKKSKFKIKYYL